eukprot:Opistho-2@53585
MSYYPGQPGYPGAPGGYPGPQQGYPGAPQGYPGAPQGYPGAPQGYPGAPGGYPGAPGGYPGSSGAYGGPRGVNQGQGNSSFAFPPQYMADPLFANFQQVAGSDGQIDAEELQRCLAAANVAGPYSQFSVDTARLLILILDTDLSGTMGFEEYRQMWAAVQQWRQTFERFDRDRSGSIETAELHEAIKSYGFNISPRAAEVITRRYSRRGRSSITFDDFIACSAKLRFISDSFRRRDTTGQGYASLSYDDFIQFSMAI